MTKEQIVSSLRTEYADLGLSDKSLESVANFILKSVTKEEDIATAIKGDSVKFLLTAIQSDTDGVRKAKLAAEKALKDYKELHPEQGDPNIIKKDDTKMKVSADDELKSLEDEVKKLKETITSMSTAGRAMKLLSDVRGKMKENGSTNDAILDLVLDKVEIAEGDTVDALATRLKGNYDSSFKKFYGNGPIPPFGGKKTESGVPDYSSLKKALIQEGKIPNPDNNKQ